MTTTRRATPRVIAVFACCAIGALAYSGAVRTTAVIAFVLPAMVVTTVATTTIARLSLRLAGASGLLAALAVAEVVNVVSGSSFGPAARSTFWATAFTVLAVIAVLSRAPALFLAAVVGVVIGALGLGAGAEVAPVAVATAVVTAVALAFVEARDRRWAGRATHLTAALFLSLLVGVIVAAIAVQSDRHLEGTPSVLAPGAVRPSIRPPKLLGDPGPRAPRSPAPAATSTPQDPSTPPSAKKSAPSHGTLWLAVLTIIVSIILATGLRVVWVALAWRWLRRRLRRGSDADRVAGAWVWATRRLRAAGWPLPVSLSVDTVAAGRGINGLPRPLRASLRELAASTTSALFAPPTDQELDRAATWNAADDIGRGAVRWLSRGRRLVFAFKPVHSRPSRPMATQPADFRENHL